MDIEIFELEGKCISG